MDGVRRDGKNIIDRGLLIGCLLNPPRRRREPPINELEVWTFWLAQTGATTPLLMCDMTADGAILCSLVGPTTRARRANAENHIIMLYRALSTHWMGWSLQTEKAIYFSIQY